MRNIKTQHVKKRPMMLIELLIVIGLVSVFAALFCHKGYYAIKSFTYKKACENLSDRIEFYRLTSKIEKKDFHCLLYNQSEGILFLVYEFNGDLVEKKIFKGLLFKFLKQDKPLDIQIASSGSCKPSGLIELFSIDITLNDPKLVRLKSQATYLPHTFQDSIQ